ncbi:AraC family transcriptional regulator [Paenibacillus sp. FSL R5-0887]|uniref:AraC family transcriptional regulator n=1 Tax=Paenibacillus sp. FSL R5-0887 TaxID=2921662 RepID=UPI0030F9D3E6
MLWDYAHIRLIDIRHMLFKAGDKLNSYRFPAAGFLYMVRGNVVFRLNGNKHAAERFHILHSGKGGQLDIDWVREEMEFYFIFYKASLSLTSGSGVRRLFERNSPFQKQYEFAPNAPVALLSQVKEMHRKWLDSSSLERIQIKAMLYQFVYEVERQRQAYGVYSVKPDLVEQAVRYIREYYSQPITLSSIAEQLNYSVAYVAKQFKSKTGTSLIDFLIRTRIDKAQELLLNTDASLQEVAAGVGYTDLSYFIRIFKKTTGVTPGNFKSLALGSAKGSDRPKIRLRLSNAGWAEPSYIVNDHDNHYQYRRKGDLPMVRNTKMSMGAAMLLCLVLMLSACSSGNSPVNSVNAGPSPVSSVQTETSPPDSATNSKSTRVYKDSQGHEVDIPERPQRIVLQGNSIGDLLALGIQPVGVDRRFIEESVYLDKETTPAQDIGFPTNLELVLDLEPDLTMLGYVMDKQYEEVSKISPTVVFDQSKPLSERLPVIGEIVGKRAEAEQLLSEYNRKAENMWSGLRQEGKLAEGETAVVLIYYWNKTMYLMKTGGIPALLYQPQGYKMSEAVKEIEPAEGAPYIEVSPELMHKMLIGDHLFVIYPANADAENSFNELMKTALWSSLPAVKSGKVTFVETKWNYDDMLTSSMLLDEFPKLLAK